MELTTPHTNRKPTFDGPLLRLGRRKRAEPTCRDEVLAAIARLKGQTDAETFTVGQVAAEMLAAGTRYTHGTICKTIQRMRGNDGRTAEPDLQRVSRTQFRLRLSGAPPARVSSAHG